MYPLPDVDDYRRKITDCRWKIADEDSSVSKNAEFTPFFLLGAKRLMSISISERAQNLKPSPTLKVSALAQELKKKGIPVISFGAGEPDFTTPDNICKKAIQSIEDGFTHYTPAGGIIELRGAVCDKLKTDNALEYDPAQVVVSCGAKHSLFNLFLVLIDPGDEVLVPSPYWVSYPAQIELAGGKMVPIPSNMENRFQISVEALQKKTTARTKGIVINSPCNPSGSVFDNSTLQSIAEWAKRHDVFIISDEIYEKLIYGSKKHTSIASLSDDAYQRTFVVNGVSKSHAMTGWRIGYAAGALDVMKKVNALQSQNTSNPASISQMAALEALTGEQSAVSEMKKAFEQRRNLMVKLLLKIEGIKTLTPEGAFYVFPDVSYYYGKNIAGKDITDSVSFCETVLEKGNIALVPGSAFGMDDHVRLSYAMSDTDIEKGLTRLKKFLAEK